MLYEKNYKPHIQQFFWSISTSHDRSTHYTRSRQTIKLLKERPLVSGL